MSQLPNRLYVFKSGAQRILSKDFRHEVLGLDDEGRIVVKTTFGTIFGLTLCCNAFDKGIDTGVVCRACYGSYDVGRYNPPVADPLVKSFPTDANPV